MNIIEAVQAGPLVWILSIITMGGIAYQFRLSLAQRRVFHEVGNTIVNAFKPELDALIQTGEDARLILTDEAFLRHDSVVLL